MTGPPERFVLHASVAARWWLPHLPYAAKANQFLTDELRSGQTGVVAVEGVELQVLDILAHDLSPVRLDTAIAGMLFDDVIAVFDALRRDRLLQSVGHRALLRSAFAVATSHDIAFSDALAVALAGTSSLPLLVADKGVYITLHEVEVERPGLRVLWLPQYLTG